MEKKIIGYRCLINAKGQFTKDKIYQLNPGKNLNDYYAFIDDEGEPNGWGCGNNKHFSPVYEVANKQLPLFWYIKGCEDLSQYFKDNNINFLGCCDIYGYYIENGIWKSYTLCKGRNINFQEITLQQYLNSINNKMENKKIYYLKQEVKLNQEIDFNGLKITVTQDLINNNPNLFQIVDDVKKQDEKYNTVLCIDDYLSFKKGNTYKSITNITDNTIKIFGLCNLTTEFTSNKHFIKIDKIKYYENSDGFIHKYYKTINSKGGTFTYNVEGNIEFCKNVKVSTEEEYNKQQEIIKTIPEYVKHKSSNKIYKPIFKPNDEHVIWLIDDFKIKYKTISNLLSFNTPSTEEEYDKQEELQQLLDEAQKRYPVGTKLSKDLTVTLHPDKKTYLVYPNKCVEVHIGNGKYFKVNGGKIWITVYKEPVKDLEYYEDKYYRGFYSIMKKAHPNLYYQLMLQTIADDLNGDWTIDWNNTTNRKYCIQFYMGDIEIDGYYNLIHSNVYFKTKALAQKAIDILGEDKLKIIFNVK